MTETQKLDRKGWGRVLLLGIQHVFAMFGATVLVPALTGMNTLVALFCAGVGTLLFHLVTKRKVPVYLGSSFAFIAVIQTVAWHYSGLPGSFDSAQTAAAAYQAALPYATGGIIVAGAVYLVLALLVKLFGVNRVKSFFPPVVTGPMIIVIGLTLAPTAIANIIGDGGAGMGARWIVALAVLLTMIIVSVFCKGFFKLVPILFSIIVGYIVALLFNMVDTTPIREASFLALPPFFLPKFDGFAILTIAPMAIVTFMEHMGDITTNGAVVGKDFMEDPGLHRTLLGDGLATMVAGFLGGPANTTYGENTGVLAVTKNYDPRTLRVAAVFAILMSVFGKLGGFLQSIPAVVMGGVSMILFGMIASVGMRTLAEADLDFAKSRNLIIISLMLVIGLGGAFVNITANVQLSGIALSALVGIVLNKVLPDNI
jgi:uracil permease